MEALNDLRQDIDALDAQLAALYRRRMDVAARIAAVNREHPAITYRTRAK